MVSNNAAYLRQIFYSMESFEHNHPLDDGIQSEYGFKQLQVNERVVKYWLEIANWCIFFGIFYLFLSLIILLGLMNKDDLYLGAEVVGNLSFVYSLLIYGTCGGLYWATGASIRFGCSRSETSSIELAFRRFYLLYAVTGILTIISILPVVYIFYNLIKYYIRHGSF